MFANYFDPLSVEILDFKEQLNPNTIGSSVQCFKKNSFPSIDTAEIALIIVPEYRGGKNKIINNSYNEFRKAFYTLYKGNWDYRIVDFGNLKSGSTLNDTYFALNDVISSLLSQSIFPIVLGGTQDLIYPIYQAYESFTKGVNLLSVDSKFDLIDSNMSILNSRNFLGYIIKQDPNHLTNYINLGYQGYLCQNDESHLLDKMLFESCRLGDLRENIKESEPYIRNADIVSVDLSSIKQSDAPATTYPSPNGLEAHHVCAIARYSGMSDRVSSFSIFEFDPSKKVGCQTDSLMGQIVWHFIEGFSLRINDSPNAKNINTNYKKYYVPIKDSDLQFIFYKSKQTGRWWFSSSMEFNDETNYKAKIIGCSYEDYLNTISGDIPKRIYRILKTIT
ncbi:MAG: arginase [Flavobacteriales bacterium]|jgi:formiminoglutamase|nr:arginase [Flavobacteriales bacterium]|tara:strand:+ start:10874 stop:12046 length:1173 start_codon:yes stop_codon:yes gene_type:complete